MSAILEKLAKSGASGEHASKAYANRLTWRRLFLRALSEHGNVVQAARDAGVHPVTVRKIKARDERFARRMADAIESYSDAAVGRIETALDDRAVNGRARTILHKDQLVVVHDKPSDKAAEIRLKALRPEVYDRRREGGTVVNLSIVNDHSRALIASDPQMLLLQCEMDARIARATSPQVALPAPPQDR